MSKAGLIREAFEVVTGVAAEMAYFRRSHNSGLEGLKVRR
jgi:hypothetical protein